MTKKLKNILLITFSAFLALSAALMLALTSSRANKVSADETVSNYSLVKKYDFTLTEDQSLVQSHNCCPSTKSFEDGKLLIHFEKDSNYSNTVYHSMIKLPFQAKDKKSLKFTFKLTVRNSTGTVIFSDDSFYDNFILSYLFQYRMGYEENGSINIKVSTSKPYLVNHKNVDTGYYEVMYTQNDYVEDELLDFYGENDLWFVFGAGMEAFSSGSGCVYEISDFSVYEETPVEPGGEDNPSEEPTGGDVTEEEPTLGDKINEVTDNIASWLKDNTGLAFSSGGVILLAVVLALILFKRR